MGYLGRRIGKSQDTATDTGSGGGGGLLDLFTNGYFQRQGNIYNAPGLPLQGLSATGGVISDYNTPPGAVYRAHIFTSSGTFEVTEPGSFGDTVEYLVVAGGGGGGGGLQAGGGGAGGLRTSVPGVQDAGSNPLTAPSFTVSTTGGDGSGSYTVTVGAGGVGGTYPGTRGGSGVDSYFGPPSTPQGILSNGGGGGGTYPNAGGAGGSGGGTACQNTAVAGGTGNTPPYSPPQGKDGGASTPYYSAYYIGGGGGGAGAVGTPDDGTTYPGTQGTGGAGVQVAIAGPAADTTGVGALNPGPGEYQWFAGGGGAGGYDPTTNDQRSGGVGGGGSSSPTINAPGNPGTQSTGGGGGGVFGLAPFPGIGGQGGSGIVVVRYQIAQLTATAKATGGAISYYDGKTIHTFTSSGTFDVPSSFNETVEYVVVGGGGGAIKGDVGGGGGAGGYLTSTIPISTPQSITVQVGSGGALTNDLFAIPGSNSSFGSPITAYGGGGGQRSPGAVQNGGSGGGGGYNANPGGYGLNPSTPAPVIAAFPLYTPGTTQGYPGGGQVTSPPAYGSGGGGGAGGAGTAGTPGSAGNGGVGIRLPSTFHNPSSEPSPTGGGLGMPGPAGGFYVAGGGGGSRNDSPGPTGTGGYGGGGNGGNEGPVAAQDGFANTGGGGGASESENPIQKGNGGSGIVLIAYPS